jgi:periplasmic nitrate reductase NapD
MRLNRYLKREAERPLPGHNICGVLVHVDPSRLLPTCDALVAMPGVEIHEQSDDGRLVLTVEDTPDQVAVATLAQLYEVPGVASAALVYHHCETDEPSEFAEEKPQ